MPGAGYLEIDAYGTVRLSQTIGRSLRGDIIVGVYTTDATFDETGTQIGSETVGESRNINEKMTGAYTTTAAFNEYGTMTKQETIGESYSYVDLNGDGTVDEVDERVVSGVYTTLSDSAENDIGAGYLEIDACGTVRLSQTRGRSLRGDIVVGVYTTEATFDEAGTQLGSETVGQSWNIRSKTTGAYTTTAEFNDYGTMTKQQTIGESYSYVDLDGDGNIDEVGERVVSGIYTTLSDSAENDIGAGYLEVDAYGTVRLSQTRGRSLRGDIVVGVYTTEATFDEAGTQLGSETVGESRNIREKTTGAYTTTAAFNEYGTMTKQQTIGESYSYVDLNGDGTVDEVGERVVSGVYTTQSDSARNDMGAGYLEIDAYGTVRLSQTTGRSLRGDIVVGVYTTGATFDEAGTQLASETVGQSWNVKGHVTGAYTTTAEFND
ncbi:MAG: hypothetical protein JRC86_08195, partial [Deltaproteobacteria bacterium]|nr:hypothetical protein [Deltaproteobacteria bacterium]